MLKTEFVVYLACLMLGCVCYAIAVRRDGDVTAIRLMTLALGLFMFVSLHAAKTMIGLLW